MTDVRLAKKSWFSQNGPRISEIPRMFDDAGDAGFAFVADDAADGYYLF